MPSRILLYKRMSWFRCRKYCWLSCHQTTLHKKMLLVVLHTFYRSDLYGHAIFHMFFQLGCTGLAVELTSFFISDPVSFVNEKETDM